MIGLRVFDVGALIVWLVWFFRLRQDDDDDGDDFRHGGDDAPDPEPGGGPPGLRLPLPDAAPWPARRRRSCRAAGPAASPPRTSRSRPPPRSSARPPPRPWRRRAPAAGRAGRR